MTILSALLSPHSFRFRTHAPVELKLIVPRYRRHPRPFRAHSLRETEPPLTQRRINALSLPPGSSSYNCDQERAVDLSLSQDSLDLAQDPSGEFVLRV